ncbi:YbaB/EbfC family nucleoid-associated protein [Corynebacterium sp. NPDC060344]|uniref:YbaB/EbfC family nucleoid-associated protein n=1 Tax=Corynebacterium sp. NPDC060344 TaxID=3347101 RepID=UPI003654C48E
MSQPDMNAILAQAQQMQAQLEAAQAEIVASSVVGEAGNGLVKLTMRGSGEVTDIALDPKAVDPEDVDGLQDLILGAFQDATTKVQNLAQEKMGPLQEGFGALGGDGLGF